MNPNTWTITPKQTIILLKFTVSDSVYCSEYLWKEYETVTNVDWPFPQYIRTASSNQQFQDFLRQIFHLGCNAYQSLENLPSTSPFQIHTNLDLQNVPQQFYENKKKRKSFVLNVSCFLNNGSPYLLSVCHLLKLFHLTRSGCFSSNLQKSFCKEGVL